MPMPTLKQSEARAENNVLRAMGSFMRALVLARIDAPVEFFTGIETIKQNIEKRRAGRKQSK